MFPTNIGEYVISLCNAGPRRFPDETRQCRTLLIVMPDKQRIEVDVPEDMLESDRQQRHEVAMREAEAYALKNPK